MKEIALEVNHVSIDYKDLSHMSLAKSLRKDGITKSNVVRAVNDISFSVNKGEILGIVGRNGSGKLPFCDRLQVFFNQMKER